MIIIVINVNISMLHVSNKVPSSYYHDYLLLVARWSHHSLVDGERKVDIPSCFRQQCCRLPFSMLFTIPYVQSLIFALYFKKSYYLEDILWICLFSVVIYKSSYVIHRIKNDSCQLLNAIPDIY